MKTIFFVLLVLLSSNFLCAQEKFKIELTVPSHINDSIIFSPPIIRRGFEEFYNIMLNTNQNIFDFGKRFGFKQSTFQITIKEKNLLEGQINYPQPVSFQYFNSKTKQVYLSSTFFLDSGYFKIELPNMFNAYEIRVNSPVNDEYSNFKKLFLDLYIKPKNIYGFDSLTSLKEKQERIGSYIKNNRNSYVALWEIIDDYTRHGYDETYLNNLKLFSTEIKKSEIYRKFEGKLKAEDLTAVGNEFPNISFDKNHSLNKDFRNYKLTFIDCWSTSCAPCIRAMPEILAMHEKYKNRGINFITVTDESEPKKIVLAKKILHKNRINWTNYFDINKNFRNKLNVTSYPFQLLINENGKIIARATADLNEIGKTIDQELEK